MILLENDCEKGEGVDLRQQYEVRVYPTFAMVNGAGEVTARWAGYPGVEEFGALVDAARGDLRTIAEKQAAYEERPTLALALGLARHAESVFATEDAVRYFRKAMALDPKLAADLRVDVFMAMGYGLRSGAFTADDLAAEARTILAAPDVAPTDALRVALMSSRFLPDEAYRPLLEKALAATANLEGDDERTARRALEVDAALLIDGDAEKALALKRQSLPEGWRDDPAQLNGFAWWCFENDLDLAEAFALAMRGVDLAESDGDRANILDTAAEIAFKRGEAARAVELQERAIALNPDREAFKEKLARFREALDS